METLFTIGFGMVTGALISIGIIFYGKVIIFLYDKYEIDPLFLSVGTILFIGVILMLIAII